MSKMKRIKAFFLVFMHLIFMSMFAKNEIFFCCAGYEPRVMKMLIRIATTQKKNKARDRDTCHLVSGSACDYALTAYSQSCLM